MKIVSLLRVNRPHRGPDAPADRGGPVRRRLRSLWRLGVDGSAPLAEPADADGDHTSGNARVDQVASQG